MSQEIFCVERIEAGGGGKREINTNNHPKDPGDESVAHLDYFTELEKTYLSRYIHLIDYSLAWTWTFNEEEIVALTEAAEKCRHLGRSLLFKEELEPVIKRLEEHFIKGLWFFRFDSCSPKDSPVRLPIKTAEQVIEMIVTSKRAWQALVGKQNKIYFTAFDYTWNPNREFRVFIHQGKVTCISQYNAYDTGMLSKESDETIIRITGIISSFLKQYIPALIIATETENFVCDVYVKYDLSCKIIELNSFGYWLSSGSALFHWINDKEKLYGQSLSDENSTIWVRIVQ